MKILSRYLLREHLGPFGFALGALTGLLVLNQLARQFGGLVGKGLSWGVIGEVFGLSFPFILAMTVPMAVLVAVLQAFSRLGADNEVTALKASGVNMMRPVRPILIAAGILSLATFVFVDQVLPRSNHRLKNLLVDIARKKPTFELKEQMINEVVPGQLFLRAGRIDQATDWMREIVIYDLANEQRKRTIYADSGFMRFNNDKTDLYLTLFSGYVHDYDRGQPEVFRRIFFQTDLVRVHGVSNRLERSDGDGDAYRGDREMNICEMEAVVNKDLRTVRLMEHERRVALENDVRVLLGVPRAAARPDSAIAPVVRRTPTALYCALLGRIAALGARENDSTLPPPVSSNVDMPSTRVGMREAPDVSGRSLKNQLDLLTSRRRTGRQHAAGFQVEIHKKYSIAASCLVFVLIGAPVALRFPRGGVGLVIGASVAIFGFYYVGLIGGETLADQLIISPFWAMWGPNLLMTAVGLWLFLRLGREHVTGRGR